MKTTSPQSGVLNAENIELPRYSRRDTLLTMSGVLMVMLLSSLDQTVVAPAMPRVIADLQGFDRYTWVSTAYLLTSTVSVPIYGKLSDLFGRKRIFIVGLVLFLLGSGLSGASQTQKPYLHGLGHRHGRFRHGPVRQHLLYPALRPGRHRHLGHQQRPYFDTADADLGCRKRYFGPISLAPGQIQRTMA